MKTKDETMYNNLLEELSYEEISLVRENRDWELYDSLNVKDKKELFINECRSLLGDLTQFEGETSHKKISKQGVVMFGKFRGDNITTLQTGYKMWCIENVDGFDEDLKKYIELNG